MPAISSRSKAPARANRVRLPAQGEAYFGEVRAGGLCQTIAVAKRPIFLLKLEGRSVEHKLRSQRMLLLHHARRILSEDLLRAILFELLRLRGNAGA